MGERVWWGKQRAKGLKQQKYKIEATADLQLLTTSSTLQELSRASTLPHFSRKGSYRRRVVRKKP
jgi:hypothetical protein